MADTKSVATLIDSTTSRIQQLQQAFAELESHSALSLNLKWKELEEHFHGLEKSLKRRFHELEDEEKEYVTKESETQQMLEKQEATVVAKEQASLERLQEKRDMALSSIFTKFKNCPSKPINAGIYDIYDTVQDTTLKENSDIMISKTDRKDLALVENRITDSRPSSQLRKLCEEMDSEGLLRFISDHRKDLAAIREEIPVALRGTTDPLRLVLDSLKDFYTGDILVLDGKKDANLLGLRRTCLMLMECLGQLLEEAVSGSFWDKQMLTTDIKEQAKMIANQWKPKIDDLDFDATNGNSLEVHAFLQLLATFGIASDFDQDEICKLIPSVSRRRQTADLCRSLGLSQKIPGVIEILLSNGRQIEAVNLAYAFELTEQFAPVALLKAYLKDARKVSQGQGKAGNTSPGAQNETSERELSALRAIIKCVEERKLEEEYPVGPLQKRVLQLEKAKADKRAAAEAAKPQSKRPRASGSMYAPRVAAVQPDKSFYRTPERYPYPYPYPMGSYAISPTHTAYYGNGPNGYQVQYSVPYLH